MVASFVLRMRVRARSTTQARWLIVAFLLAGAAPVDADPITFSGNMGASTDDLGNFSASLSYTANNSTDATLTISLENTTPSAGGYLTGFVLNKPSGVTSESLSSASYPFTLITNASAAPFGIFDFGAALGGDWLGGASPNDGILVGSTGTFVFDLTGTGLNSLNASSFGNELTDGQYFVARFKGMSGGGSDKVPAGTYSGSTTGGTTGGTTGSTTGSTTGPIPAVPEPASLTLWAALGLGMAGYAARKRRQARAATRCR